MFLFVASTALAQVPGSETIARRPVAGHAVFDLRAGIQTSSLQHVYLCAEGSPTAWLSFEAKPEGKGSRLIQTALFSPKGLWGFLYWYAMYPAHRFIFGGMCQAIADDAVRLSRGEVLG